MAEYVDEPCAPCCCDRMNRNPAVICCHGGEGRFWLADSWTFVRKSAQFWFACRCSMARFRARTIEDANRPTGQVATEQQDKLKRSDGPTKQLFTCTDHRYSGQHLALGWMKPEYLAPTTNWCAVILSIHRIAEEM